MIKHPCPTLTRTAVLVCLLAFGASASAQDGTIYPLDAPAEPNAIALGTGGVAGQASQESWFRQWGDPMARNVSAATLTPFLPAADKANGAAVIVAPGGGFRWLSMGNEGWEVAEALRAKGIAAFVLKYRLQPTPESLDELPRPPGLPAQVTASRGHDPLAGICRTSCRMPRPRTR
jgi:hypothetical protein